MAKPIKYPIRRMITQSDEQDQRIQKVAAIMEVKPAVAVRILADHAAKAIVDMEPANAKKATEAIK